MIATGLCFADHADVNSSVDAKTTKPISLERFAPLRCRDVASVTTQGSHRGDSEHLREKSAAELRHAVRSRDRIWRDGHLCATREPQKSDIPVLVGRPELLVGEVEQDRQDAEKQDRRQTGILWIS